MDVRVGLWRRLSAKELMLLSCGLGEDFWESLGLQGDPTSPFWRKSALGFLWKEWCQSWNSSTLATSCEELTHWKRLWCWEELGLEEKGMTEDEMVGWHHRLNGHEFVWTPGVGDRQGSLACCDSGVTKSQTRLSDWTELKELATIKWIDQWGNQKIPWGKVKGNDIFPKSVYCFSVAKSCPPICDPMDSGFTVLPIVQIQWNTSNAVIRGKLIVIHSTLKKQESPQTT